MTSSMSSGERRWASARRGGMTVLGKVAVPKPLNLPSQRLENHGLDPSVEIVPKGTLSWGSRSSSSASNAWGSSTLSPNADGGNSSPSHLSGRPSSGSGTRPSTAGSDRTRDPTPTAWGQNSRPSSASGALTTSQTTLTSLRPRSAETRPGSSQLSRFAESPSDSSIAWGPTGGVSEKLGVVASSKNDGFALSSGDFPTLGSERENSGKNVESKDLGSYGRPDLSSGRAASGKEKSSTSLIGSCDVSVNANVKSFSGNTWRRDGSPQHVEDGVQHAVEKWQGDPPHYLNANVPPQHFEAWHGPPINPPPGVWYRGPPGGPPYGTPLGPGGFPIEPFPYYRPQIPPPALTNSQPVPPPGAGPRGPHPKNGDRYRPHIPDAYIRPGMPIRPGFFPGPMAFDGYYGPPMGYCNANERDIPFMGMAASPPVYNRYSCDNGPDPGNNHARAGPHGSSGKTFVSEQMESGHPDGSQGTYKVILKQHSEWDEKQEEDKWEDAVPASARYPGEREPPGASPMKNEWGLEDRKDEEINYGRRTHGGDACSRNYVNQGSSSDSVKVKLPENGGKAKAVDDGLVTKSENAASSFPQLAQVAPASSKDPTLIQKIECLNAKARASDGRPDSASNLSGEELKGSSRVDAKASYLMNEAGTRSVNFERTHTSGNIVTASHEVDISAEDKTLHPAASSGAAGSRRTSQVMQGRLDHHGKSFNTQDADGWQKKPSAESINANSAARSEPSTNIHLEEHLPSAEAAERYGIDLQGKDGGEFLTPVFDSSDCQVQRAKMREMAKQRARQLQKEEEERTREQKAKALAKLEELNRRTQSIDGPTQKFEKAPPSCPIQLEQEGCQIPAEQVMVVSKSETLSSALVSIPNAQIRESSNIESAVPTKSTSLEISNNVQHEPSVTYGQSLPLQPDAHAASAAKSKGASLDNEDSVSRHKIVGYKQKQNSSSLGTSLTQRSVPVSPTEASKGHSDVAASYVASTEVAGEVGWSSESSLPMSSNAMAESSAHQRRKNNKSGKNKHKLDDVPAIAAAPSPLLKETNAEKFSTERGKTRTSELEFDPSSVQSKADAKQTIHPSEEHSSLSIEDAGGRVNSQLKSQHTRRMPRNQQANRMADKFHSSDNFIWAPVRSQSKAEVTDEASDKMMPNTATETSKSDNLVHNNLKSKRAEMERYVPKPVAKELAQQGSTQQSAVSSVNQISLDGTVGRAEPFQNIDSCEPGNSAIGIVGSTVESWNGDGKQNKQSKAHGPWRQRGLVESGFQDGASSQNPSKSILKSTEQHQSLMPDVHSMKEQTKSSDDWNTSDGWNTPQNSDTAAPVVKDQVITSRGKRHPFKGHRSMGNNHDYDQRNVNSGDTGKSSFQTPAPEMGQIDKGIASKDSRGFGERTSSHWQPKSQLSSDHNQRGNRPGGGQNATAEVTNAVRKEPLSKDRVHPPPHHNKEHREHVLQPPTDESLSEQKNMAGVPTLGHQESKRERKVASFRGRPHSPNPSSVNMIEPAPPASLDPQNEQRFSSFRRNGNQNNRSGRGYESRGDWSSAAPDDRQHNTSSNRERQRHNSHYEYQPIGQYNNNKSNNSEGTTSGSNNRGSRHRERNQGHSRRGGSNFSGQQSGTVHVDANYDD